MFAKLLGWPMHLHSYLKRVKGNFKKMPYLSTIILLDALWVCYCLSKVIPFQRPYVLSLRHCFLGIREMAADHCLPELNIQ